MFTIFTRFDPLELHPLPKPPKNSYWEKHGFDCEVTAATNTYSTNLDRNTYKEGIQWWRNYISFQGDYVEE